MNAMLDSMPLTAEYIPQHGRQISPPEQAELAQMQQEHDERMATATVISERIVAIPIVRAVGTRFVSVEAESDAEAMKRALIGIGRVLSDEWDEFEFGEPVVVEG